MKEYLLYLTDADGMPYSTHALIHQLEQQFHTQFLKLYLSWDHPDDLVIRKLIDFLKNLPPYVHGLNCRGLFENNQITNPKTLKNIVGSLPLGLRQLEIDYLIPPLLDVEYLEEIFLLFPDSIEHLSLSGNRLSHILNFVVHFAANYVKLTSLDIRALCIYEEWSTELFNVLLSCLPQQITTLYVNLDWMIKEQQKKLCPVLSFPQHIRTLNLIPKEFWQNESLLDVLDNSNVNTLGWFEEAIWPELIVQTPKCIHSLSFDNYLPNAMEHNTFIECMKSIPPHITSLSLKNNHLYLWHFDNLLQLFRAIPKTVKNLVLEGNALFIQLTNMEQEQLLNVLKTYQTDLNCHTVPYELEDSIMTDPLTSDDENTEFDDNFGATQLKTQDLTLNEYNYQSSPEYLFDFFKPKNTSIEINKLGDPSEKDSFDLFASLENSLVNREY
ncbi:MAG: hypothetical protein BGO90_11115 [Legionella sp. 40-6]|nr:hypothetical protein [Legionella sp.]OJY40226.1 MAG: hypothetical protein BGO90_11115 [Legionella sp. 40-6]